MARREWLMGRAVPARMARSAELTAEGNRSERRRTDPSEGAPAVTPRRGEATAQGLKAATGSLRAEMLDCEL